MKNAASPPVADDDSDCVSSSNFGACTASDSNAPTGRRRRTILSAHGRDSESFTIEFSRCEKSTIDAHGIETCVQLKTKNHAKTASLAVFTGVLLCTFHYMLTI